MPVQACSFQRGSRPSHQYSPTRCHIPSSPFLVHRQLDVRKHHLLAEGAPLAQRDLHRGLARKRLVGPTRERRDMGIQRCRDAGRGARQQPFFRRRRRRSRQAQRRQQRKSAQRRRPDDIPRRLERVLSRGRRGLIRLAGRRLDRHGRYRGCSCHSRMPPVSPSVFGTIVTSAGSGKVISLALPPPI